MIHVAKICRLTAILSVLVLDGADIRAQVIAHAVAPGGSVTLTVANVDGASPVQQWRANGTPLTGATASTLNLTAVQPADAGLYTAISPAGTEIGSPLILGLQSNAKIIGQGEEVARDIYVAANGNTFDQVLLRGPAIAITSDYALRQITRLSFVDLSNDIVQVEFSGPGTLSLVLDNYSAAAPPVNYQQAVDYVKGHAGIVITGATEDTNVSVFSVGRITAFNQTLFKTGVSYDGLADLAFIAIASTNGKFGGVRTANASYFAAKGLTGLYAPGVEFDGPIYIGDIHASGRAIPAIIVGSSAETRVTGGNLFQSDDRPVAIAGIPQLLFTAGQDSHGNEVSAKTNRAAFQPRAGSSFPQILDNVLRVPPSLSLRVSAQNADESGLEPAVLTVLRNGGTEVELRAAYEVGGSATPGSDYVALSGQLIFPAGVEAVEIPIVPRADGVTEGAETITLTLRPSEEYLLDVDHRATAWIADGIHAYLETIRTRYGLPGIVASVFDSERVIAVGAAGTRKIGSGVPLLHTDKLQIASISKTITATVVAKLVEDGALSWDATLAQLYPELADAMTPAYRSVTVDMMLRHLGGFPQGLRTSTIVKNWIALHRHLNNSGQRYEAVKYMVTRPVAYAPGTTHYYTNDSFLVLGNICERVAGKTWEELLTASIFEPLEMHASGFGNPANDRSLDNPWGHTKSRGVFVPVDPAPEDFGLVPFGSPYGGILHSSAVDLARYGIFHLRGDLGIGEGLTTDTFRRLHHARLTALQPLPERFSAGFFNEGRLETDGRWVNVQHWGYYADGRTLFWFSPQENVGAIILTNGTEEDPVAGMRPLSEIVIELYRRYRSTPPQPLAGNPGN